MRHRKIYQIASILGLFAAATIVGVSVGTGQPAKPRAPAQSVLRVVPHSNLTWLDPIWTPIYITRNHGYLIYDTLFGVGADGKVHPQMVDTWTVSPDGLIWTFKLRDGLKWHDGQNVTADDCVTSLRRWSKRDGAGQQLFDVIEEISATDPKTITMKLRAPYNRVLESLGQLSSYVPFMMPKRVAETDPYTQITDYTGSGPFIFKKDEFVAGVKSAYVKNPNYVPRAEPSSWAAGGKVAKVDRIEWVSFPTSAQAVAALTSGRVDYLEQLDPKFIPQLEQRKDIVAGLTGPDPFIGLARFNHLVPPFNKREIRRAVMMAMNQTDYMNAAVGSRKYWKTCYSVYPCNSPLATDAGSEFFRNATMEDARKALKEAGYDGTPVVILNAVDMPVVATFTKVTADKLRQLGMKVEVRDTGWASMTSQRTTRGGSSPETWNLFHTFWAAVDLRDPTRIVFSGDPVTGWFGWAEDQELERYRAEYAQATDPQEQKRLAAKVQERLYDIGAFAPLGEFFLPVAYRNSVQDVQLSPVQFYWNMWVKK